MILGSCAVPKPRARGFASGLHHPLTLALTLRALFAGRKGKCLEKLPPVAAALERQKHSQTIERAFRAWLIDTLEAVPFTFPVPSALCPREAASDKPCFRPFEVRFAT